MENRPARDQDAKPLGGLEELRRERRGVDDLLEIVEDEEHLPVSDRALEGLAEWLVGDLANVERRCDGRRNEPWVADGRQLDEEDTIRVSAQAFRGDLQCQARLPGAAWTGQRDEAGTFQEIADGGDLRVPADEAGELGGQVIWPGIERAKRRELVWQTVDLELEEVLRLGQVLEAVRSKAAHAHAVRQSLLDKSARRVGYDDLAAVPCGGDPRGAVDVEPDVVVAAASPLAGMDSHPNPHLGVCRPGLRSQRALRRDGGGYRPRGVREGYEEAVSLGPDLGSVTVCNRPANDPAMLVEQLGRVFGLGTRFPSALTRGRP